MKDLFSFARVLFERHNGGGKYARAGAAEDLDFEESKWSVLLISPAEEDGETLQQDLSGTHWSVVTARDCHEAFRILLARRIPVVLYDRDLPGLPWHQTLRFLSSLRPACVVLVSRVSDSYLWEEVIQRGGFDVLTKPYRREELVRTLDFALKHWRTGWIRRDWDRFQFKD